MTDKIIYMIRRNSDGLFSTGGTSPTFTTKGKAWSTLGALKNHLNQAVRTYALRNNYIEVDQDFKSYLDCTIVSYKVVRQEGEPPALNLESYFIQKIDEAGVSRKKYSGYYDKPVMVKYPNGETKTL